MKNVIFIIITFLLLYYSFLPASSSECSLERIATNNIDGFRTNTQINKIDSIYRVAIIGGSVADVLGGEKAPNGQCLLEFELDSILGTNNIEVIGAGTSGYVVEQEFIETQLILQKYKPDFILGLHGYNDLMTFKLNRYINDQILLPPQNYREHP